MTVTWPPILYTDYGFKNFKNWLNTCNVENISAKRDENTMRLLTKLSIQNLMHPFQTFILGQKIFAAKMAIKYNIPLYFLVKTKQSMEILLLITIHLLRDKSYFTYNNIKICS